MEQGGLQEPTHKPKMRRKQVGETTSTESFNNNTQSKRKPRDPEFYRRIGSIGGKKTKEKHGLEHLQSLAKEGGKANADKHDNSYFSEIGQKGGERTRERHGIEHFKEIGSEGGKKPRKKRKQTPPSDET